MPHRPKELMKMQTCSSKKYLPQPLLWTLEKMTRRLQMPSNRRSWLKKWQSRPLRKMISSLTYRLECQRRKGNTTTQQITIQRGRSQVFILLKAKGLAPESWQFARLSRIRVSSKQEWMLLNMRLSLMKTKMEESRHFDSTMMGS